MAHWETQLPGRIYHQRYEDLVADFDTQARDLLDACGLAWEDACLEFHRHGDASTTASATQVRRPVYQTSVERWRRYTDQLAPLIRVLEQRGIDPEL